MLSTFHARRALLKSLTLGGSALAFPVLYGGCRRPLQREDILAALAQDVVVPDTLAVATESERLEQTVANFCHQPTVESLSAARAAWLAANLAWKRAAWFKRGPLQASNALLRATFWPVRPPAIEMELSGSQPLDNAWLERQGVDVKGMYALEYLLFPLEQADAQVVTSFTLDEQRRRGALAMTLVQDIALHARAAKSALADGEGFAARFAAGGQTGLSELVNQMIASVELVAINRLDFVLGLQSNHLLKPREVEGWPSGSSFALVQAELNVVERLYRGAARGGVADLVRQVAPAIDEHMRALLATGLAEVNKIGGPLERVVQTQPELLVKARDALKALEVAFKVDVASALGVTLTFQMGDGD